MIFWKWWTAIVLLAVSVFAGQWYFEIVNFVLDNDSTYLSLGIFGLFVATSTVVGYWCYQVQNGNTIKEATINPVWFISDLLMSLGMVGTLLGFLMVLTSSFQNIDVSDLDAMQTVIGQLAAGMGIALLTSLVGLVSSLSLKIQLVMLVSAIELGKGNETL